MGEATNLVRPPAPALAPFVAVIGYHRGGFGHARERALATGGTQLLVNLAADETWWHPVGEPAPLTTRGAAWQGPGTGPALIDPADQREIARVRFRPGGAYPFLPAPPSAVRDQLVSLDELWGRDGGTLRDRLLGAVTGCGRVPDRARLAVEHGYHDQPHMIHDFQAFGGLSPTSYQPRSTDAQNHVPGMTHFYNPPAPRRVMMAL
ncbi:DUF6597 domain-containing transcriptional factor [Micromonospora sp. NPDC023814]|uniref:DUF6597 domain-containing transcriptional factor n=1 Tax=Micromonospora sp. NPDC023814 TaxID=3154596 RepID=UPI0033E343CC